MTLHERLAEGSPLSLGELAHYLGYSREQVRKWAEAGVLKVSRAHPRAHRRVSIEEARRFVRDLH